MDIRDLALRSHGFAARSGRAAATEDQAAVNNASQAAQAVQSAQVAQRTAAVSDVAPAAQNAQDGNAAAEATARQPATQERFSPAGRLLNVLQSVEQRHPEETKQVLSNIADRLRSDSENGGMFSERLSKWADRFQQAAESGDMSNLMPRYQQAHFGMRAYQQNQPAAEGDATVEHVAGVAAEHASRPPAARSGVPDATVEQAANAAATTIAPQKSSLVDNNGASDMRNNNQTPPIIVAAAS